MPGSRLTVRPYGAFLLVLLCFTVYANVLTGDFIWDDQLQVVRNTNIRTLENVPRAFTSSLWSFMYSKEGGENNRIFDRYYRPLQTVTYILAYQLGGLSPFVYHLINVILHSAATVLVYWLCLEVGLPSMFGLMAGALFATHPVHTEAVSWIAGVGDLLCGIFYFAALVGFLRFNRSRRPGWLWMSLICFLAALFSKEMAATLPAVIVLLMFLTQRKQRPNFKTAVLIVSPYFAVLGIYGAFRVAAVGVNLPSAVYTDASIIDWASLGISVAGQYFRYAVVPYPLYIYHLIPLHFHDRVPATLLFLAGVSVIAATSWVLRRRFPEVLLWLAIFGVSLMPVLYFRGISGGVFFAERYLYIPSIAIVVLAGFFLARLNSARAAIITCSLVGLFSLLTVQRNRDWRNEESLYKRTLQYQPEAANIWTSLAEIYLRREDNAQAQQDFKLALQHVEDPRFAQNSYESYRIYLGLGTAAARQSMPVEASAYLQKALEIYPQGDGAYTQLGGVLLTWGSDYKGAMSLLEKAIQLSAVNELARDYMGVALLNQGQYERAIKYFREALQINPDLQSAKQHLQLALQAKNQ